MQGAAMALTSLGHVYTAIGDYQNALATHKQCVQLVKQLGKFKEHIIYVICHYKCYFFGTNLGDRLQEAREIGNVGAVYLAMGEFDSAVDCHTQHLRLAKRLGNVVCKYIIQLTINNDIELLSFIFIYNHRTY